MKKNLIKAYIVLTVLLALFFLIDGRAYILAKSASYKALKVFEYYKSIELSSTEGTINKPHFIIKNRGADEGFVEEIGNLLEKSYDLIGKEFDYYPNKTIPVFVYGSMDEFWAHNKALEGQAIMGLYNMGVIHIVTPDVFAMTMEKYELNGPILHEYTHLVVDELTGGNIEIWFTEGMALYQEYNIYGTEWGEFMDYEDEYSLEDLRGDFMALDSDKAYRKAFLIIKDIYSNEGDNEIKEFMKELKSGKDFYRSFMTLRYNVR
ncbi:gluzincin family metallopeptidase [Lutispora thermophila]|uniref:Peptidase MA superfamily protein n=1 Tax=Lutispora thermophila DSM 19022 TaxID=1122184 RepID=A0A1M6GVL9_9FIRM|nr:hypothetical protein [Lutispora thermophila]SHJ13986.1 hypothetical protein SAMN02745176_02536 [Lutispora thermophila DSM 19022]